MRYPRADERVRQYTAHDRRGNKLASRRIDNPAFLARLDYGTGVYLETVGPDGRRHIYCAGSVGIDHTGRVVKFGPMFVDEAEDERREQRRREVELENACRDVVNILCPNEPPLPMLAEVGG